MKKISELKTILHKLRFVCSPICPTYTTVHAAAKSADSNYHTATVANLTNSTLLDTKGATGGAFVMEYSGGSPSASPEIMVYGIGVDNKPMQLHTTDGDSTGTLSYDTTNDARVSTTYYTLPVHFDFRGCPNIIVAVKTAAAGMTTATVLMRTW